MSSFSDSGSEKEGKMFQVKRYYSGDYEEEESPSPKKMKTSADHSQPPNAFHFRSLSQSEESQSGDEGKRHSSDVDDSIDSEDDRQLQMTLSGRNVASKSIDDQSDEERPSMSMGSVAASFLMEPSKKTANYNPVAEKLMQKMGYKSGTGLGKFSQGRVEIVEASKQKGRRGLGMTPSAFKPTDIEWNFDKDEVLVEESVDWLPEPEDTAVPTLEEMMTWMRLGPKQKTIDDQTEFVNPKVLQDVLSCKSVFDDLEDEEMRRARTRSNPYETIRGAFFLNRAAMKMANMDAVLDFMFTNPKDADGKPLVHAHELLYFADVCAGPGGFSEYVLWRKKWDSKGFGFTLRGANDFKLENFFAAPSELFEPHYGVGGLEGDGNIYRPDNLDEFRRFVWDSTDGKGCHFVMADGGFSVEGQENIQEILSKQLYLCQFLCALSILRTGGSFVCKLFDLFTPFSVGLVYLMYKAFHQVSIYKPVTSRPANSERYIVCKNLRENAGAVHDYMYQVNIEINKFGVLDTQDVSEVVPLDVIKADSTFYSYICESNNNLGEKQSIALAKIQAFAKNSDLHDHRQAEVREQCLEYWKIPDELRTAPTKEVEKRFKAVEEKEDTQCFARDQKVLSTNISSHIKSVFDYRCVVYGGEPSFFFGLGKSHVYKWDKRRNKWMKAEDKLELPKDTLVQGEIVQELRGQGKAQRRMVSLHIIDALVLCGVDIRNLHFNERIERLKKFTKAINRPTLSHLAPVRLKDVFKLEDVHSVFERLEMRICKGFGHMPQLCYQADVEKHIYYKPRGMIFIKTVQEPWMMAFSRSNQRKYYYNMNSRQSLFETPKDAISPFKSCHEHSLYWSWDDGVKVHDSQQNSDASKISRDTIMNFVLKHTPR